MLQLEIKDLSVHYNTLVAVNSTSFNLKPGEIGCLLGPSGCGKTTILRTIAGFETPNKGEIILHGQKMSGPGWAIAAEKRQVGMVFQDFALFPHLTVAENISFGLNGTYKSNKQRMQALLELVGLPNIEKKYPHELSGGQQQRVALARAVAPGPTLLLLDEPFSNIDIELREQLAKDVRDVLNRENITALLVTHDQTEAFAIADHIGVMRAGQLHQWDTAYNLYHKPIDLFVADFIGRGVLIDGKMLADNRVQTNLGIIKDNTRNHHLKEGDEVSILIRPDDIIHDDTSKQTAKVVEKAFQGAEFLYTLEMNNNTQVLCFAPSHHDHQINEAIGIRLELDHLVIFKKI